MNLSVHTLTCNSCMYTPCEIYQFKPWNNLYMFRKLIKTILIVMPLMGFTWVIGLLAVGSVHEALAYVFVVLNSLQVSDEI